MARNLQAPAPREPWRCDQHGEDTVDITHFGGRPQHVCVHCGGDPTVDADVAYTAEVERYTAKQAEYDAQTVRIHEIEAELVMAGGAA